jgi:peptidoglycan L-alanyl-D-glutamate endopeptidase CwlK
MNEDKVTLERIESAHPSILEELKCIYSEIVSTVNSKYVKVRFTEVNRSNEKQNSLYKIGRSIPGRIVTWVRGGFSFHNYGLAVDICLLIDKDKNGSFETASWDTVFDGNMNGIAEWVEVAKIFKFYGWQWGLISKKGKHYDLPHFQKSMGFTTKQLIEMPVDEDGYVILD